MKYSVDKQDHYTGFQVEEENLNSDVASDLMSEMVILASEGVTNLILDLSKVEYIDSAGLSAILKANRFWKGYGSFVLTGVLQASVRRLIEIVRLDSVVPITPTKQEAVEFVLQEEQQRKLDAEGGDGD